MMILSRIITAPVTFFAAALTLLLLTVDATHITKCDLHKCVLRPPFASTRLSIRGGGNNKNQLDTKKEVSAVGVLDLRATSDNTATATCHSDSILFYSNSVGTFPTDETYDEKDDEDENQKAIDMQSAAAETVGSLCNSIYLIITYDPLLGKTILQRTAGVKLAAVVNGIRQKLMGGKHTKNIKLTLLLVRGGEEGEETPSPISTNDISSWDTSGAEFLVDRLRTFFSMGLESTKEGMEEDNGTSNIEPFNSVDIVPLVPSPEITISSKILQVVSSDSSIEYDNSASGEASVSNVQSTYESMGGIGQIKFQ